ncbi:hypothetical protein GALMADRAFT_235010 [Galerina marginata CBS 339.88]|uniref:NADAR domain-containing protein n=1 Tax=Galerina marginata (strain CBS 339.88) TaxID=685588 RepID=A0A067TU58_GALM3|nr:hypothetical protein GALMADRAFT_235010 [Galerina marginata CBS 339.88]
MYFVRVNADCVREAWLMTFHLVRGWLIQLISRPRAKLTSEAPSRLRSRYPGYRTDQTSLASSPRQRCDWRSRSSVSDPSYSKLPADSEPVRASATSLAESSSAGSLTSSFNILQDEEQTPIPMPLSLPPAKSPSPERSPSPSFSQGTDSFGLPARVLGDSPHAAPTHTYSHVRVSPSDESSKPINATTTGLNASDVKPEELNTPASTQAYIIAFFVDTLPRQLYLYLLLRLPYLYFSRVTRIFEEAELSMPMIRQGILDAAKLKMGGYEIGQSMDMGRGWGHPRHPWWLNLEPSENMAYTRLQHTWQTFIDSLLKEWKTLNIISALLLTAILTILQIESAASDPVTRFSALLSMMCALMSLLYGCIYIIRFGTMRKTYKGAEWAQEAQKTRTGIFWNVWVLLAMPATWLAWSMTLFVVTIMAFVWRTSPFPASQSSTTNPSMLSISVQLLVPRIIISVVLSLGVVYFVLIAATLRRYGEMMDRAWQRRISGWVQDGAGLLRGPEKHEKEQGTNRVEEAAPQLHAKGAEETKVKDRRSLQGADADGNKKAGKPWYRQAQEKLSRPGGTVVNAAQNQTHVRFVSKGLPNKDKASNFNDADEVPEEMSPKLASRSQESMKILPPSNNPSSLQFDEETAQIHAFLSDPQRQLTYRDRVYPTAMHLFEAMKFIDTRPDIAETIRNCADVNSVHNLAKEFEEFKRPYWTTSHLNVLDEVLLTYAQQDPDLASRLLDSHDAYVASDEYRSIARGEKGHNVVGDALVRIRERVRTESL